MARPRKTREPKTCETCTQTYVSNRYGAAYKNSRFCSVACSNRRPVPKTLKNCAWCNKEFYVYPSRLRLKYCDKKCLAEKAKTITGSNLPSYRGKTPYLRVLRTRAAYKEWRKAVFERDDYTCVWCGVKGKKLNADHIKPFAHFPELRLELSNGRTLCVECHRKTDTWAGKGIKRKKVSYGI